ncbi:Kae1-associated serine/threonine protein kinase [Candidatus Woesearchaeota archaeon]|nr:Kae1-associated serine/threonine protein kinase [Candidatus Woesearchaeota archaeon]
MLKIAQGAEAVLYQDGNQVIKERLSKGYRIPEIDEALRKFRTRREAKILQRLDEIKFPAPHLQEFSDKRMSITMDFIPGEKLRDVLEKGDEYQGLAKELGMKIGQLHAQNIIHGDLTTSNMLVAPETRELSFIDFGLSVFSDKVEDKAVDLFLLDRALESKHYQLYPQVFEEVLKGYKESYPEAGAVLDRFNAVMKRGRNKKR